MNKIEVNPSWPQWKQNLANAVNNGNVSDFVLSDTALVPDPRELAGYALPILDISTDTIRFEAGDTVLRVTVKSGIERTEEFYAEVVSSLLRNIGNAKPYELSDKHLIKKKLDSRLLGNYESMPPVSGVVPRKLDEWDSL